MFSHPYVYHLHLFPLSFFSVLLQLIISESPLINWINVISDALSHALVPIAALQFLDRTGRFLSLAWTVVWVSQALTLLVPLFEKKKSLGSINPGSGAASPYTSPVHQCHSSKHLKQHRFDIELGDVSLAIEVHNLVSVFSFFGWNSELHVQPTWQSLHLRACAQVYINTWLRTTIYVLQRKSALGFVVIGWLAL